MAVQEPSAVNPAILSQRTAMRNMIVATILLLTLVGANGIVARTANADDNPCIACQNRCLKLDPANYANCKLKCKGSRVCLGQKRSK
jgi:hypothetical protein